MKKRRWIGLSAAALLLVGTMDVSQSLAYFTTHTEAENGYKLSLGKPGTTIDEGVSNMTKHVVVTNTGTRDCYVRVRAYAGASYEGGLQYIPGDDKWERRESSDGVWYYYKDIVTPSPEGAAPGEGTAATSPLDIKIEVPKDMETENVEELRQEFNVVVVQEYTPVLYDAEGEPYADWEMGRKLPQQEEGDDGR